MAVKTITIDLEAREARWPGGSFAIGQPESAREALTSGRWDPIGELLEASPLIAERAATLPYLAPTAA